jgi:CheY-like chemotaxis protein
MAFSWWRKRVKNKPNHPSKPHRRLLSVEWLEDRNLLSAALGKEAAPSLLGDLIPESSQNAPPAPLQQTLESNGILAIEVGGGGGSADQGSVGIVATTTDPTNTSPADTKNGKPAEKAPSPGTLASTADGESPAKTDILVQGKKNKAHLGKKASLGSGDRCMAKSGQKTTTLNSGNDSRSPGTSSTTADTRKLVKAADHAQGKKNQARHGTTASRGIHDVNTAALGQKTTTPNSGDNKPSDGTLSSTADGKPAKTADLAQGKKNKAHHGKTASSGINDSNTAKSGQEKTTRNSGDDNQSNTDQGSAAKNVPLSTDEQKTDGGSGAPSLPDPTSGKQNEAGNNLVEDTPGSSAQDNTIDGQNGTIVTGGDDNQGESANEVLPSDSPQDSGTTDQGSGPDVAPVDSQTVDLPALDNLIQVQVGGNQDVSSNIAPNVVTIDPGAGDTPDVVSGVDATPALGQGETLPDNQPKHKRKGRTAKDSITPLTPDVTPLVRASDGPGAEETPPISFTAASVVVSAKVTKVSDETKPPSPAPFQDTQVIDDRSAIKSMARILPVVQTDEGIHTTSPGLESLSSPPLAGDGQDIGIGVVFAQSRKADSGDNGLHVTNTSQLGEDTENHGTISGGERSNTSNNRPASEDKPVAENKTDHRGDNAEADHKDLRDASSDERGERSTADSRLSRDLGGGEKLGNSRGTGLAWVLGMEEANSSSENLNTGTWTAADGGPETVPDGRLATTPSLLPGMETRFFQAVAAVPQTQFGPGGRTGAKTVLIQHAIGPSGSLIDLHPSNEALFFAVAEAASEVEPLQVAGTALGTMLVRNLGSSSESSGPQMTITWTVWGLLSAYALVLPIDRKRPCKTIMLVEPHEPTRDAMCVMLVQEGYLVLPAGSAHDAMGVLRAPLAPIDVMLLDIHLPDVNGIQLCARLRELYPRLPALVCTGEAGPNEMAQLRNLGVQHYLPKPFGFQELLTTVRSAMR